MKKTHGIASVIISALVFTFLFYREYIGLNLMIFELLVLAWIKIDGKLKISGINGITAFVSVILTSFFTILVYSDFAIIMNFIAMLFFIGVLIYPESRSLANALLLSISNLLRSQFAFFRKLTNSKIYGSKFGYYFRRLFIFIGPLLIIIIFIMIYRSANPVFDNIIVSVFGDIGAFLESIFGNIDGLIIFTFILGLIVSNIFLLRTSVTKIIAKDQHASDNLIRFKPKFKINFRNIALKNEFRSGIFLLFILNAILLLVNFIDVKWVWFNFEWEGEYLKQFVHEGTYLLILSMLISVSLVLYYFRRNLNFYSRNKWLKNLSYIWLIQNIILAISVAIRNFWYINYFSLAYKRIGVIIFLILTIYGLYTVFVKVMKRKSGFYLLRKNIYACFVVLIVASAFNWDIIIAKYNFNHAQSSFLHLNFMASLSDKTLPYLEKPLPELQKICEKQYFNYQNERLYMSPEMYCQLIESRKAEFIQKWEAKGILSWNLPEYLAYQKLINSAHTVVSK